MSASWLRRGTVALLVAALLAFPVLVTVPYFLHLAILTLIWVIVAQGLNVIQGYTGYVSIAQAGFMGVGAYTSTLLAVRLGWPVWITMPLALVAAGLVGALVGYPSLRVRGHYFAIVTLAYNMVIYLVLVNANQLTGGDAGLPGIPRPEPLSLPGVGLIGFRSRPAYYYLALALTLLVTLAVRRLVRSRIGRVLVAIRQNETLAQATGVACWRYKLLAFVVSAACAGLGGALYAHYVGFINPSPFGVDNSLNAILAVILGGSGTLPGPALGALLLVLLPEYLRIAQEFRLIIYGLVLILITIYLPRGLVPILARLAGRVAPASSALGAAPPR
jgi:branched-chain amino acid transport system permease protein